jgi:hypothetical protein
MERYIVCMFIGHGRFMTQYNSRGTEDLVPVDASPLEVGIFTFAPPGESCWYPPDKLIELKDKLITYSRPVQTFDRSFIDIIQNAEIETVGAKYSSDQWAPYFNRSPDLSELYIRSNSYFEKEFSTDKRMPSGVYIIKSNVGLRENNFVSFRDKRFKTLSGIINFFKTLDINKLFIFDTTCSVFANPEYNNYISDDRTIRRLRKDILTMPRRGGRKINKYSKKKRTQKNKTRKAFFKRKHK